MAGVPRCRFDHVDENPSQGDVPTELVYTRAHVVECMSAIVSLVVGLAALLLGLPLVFTIIVVNFIGGYIPYIGAFLGGGLAVIIALGDGGMTDAVIMLVVVLAANLVLENFVEPKVMGRPLDVHALIVLVVTALGGLLGRIVGLILAVPAWVIAGNAISRARSRGMLDVVGGFANTGRHAVSQPAARTLRWTDPHGRSRMGAVGVQVPPPTPPLAHANSGTAPAACAY